MVLWYLTTHGLFVWAFNSCRQYLRNSINLKFSSDLFIIWKYYSNRCRVISDRMKLIKLNLMKYRKQLLYGG